MEKAVDVSEVIDRAGVSKAQCLVIVLCAVVAVFDGFDLQTIAISAPVITREWGLSPHVMGSVFILGLLGMAVGALLVGLIGDRFGRKAALILSILTFGIFTFATALATSYEQVLLYRFLTGIGLGGATPIAIALTSEYSPRRLRGMMIVSILFGIPVGGIIAGLLGAAMIPKWGWRSLFWVGGALPIVSIPALMILLPESVQFLVAQGEKAKKKVARVLNQIHGAGGYDETCSFFLPEVQLRGFPVKHLFTEGLARETVLIWLSYFMNLLNTYFLLSWLPTLLSEAKFSIGIASVGLALLNFGGGAGSLAISWFIYEYTPRKVLSLYFTIGALCTLAVGFASTHKPVVLVLTLFMGFFNLGAQGGMTIMATNLYPTLARSTGLGWMYGIGRVGSISGALTGGVMMSLGWDIGSYFFFFAIPLLVAAAAISLVVDKPTGSTFQKTSDLIASDMISSGESVS